MLTFDHTQTHTIDRIESYYQHRRRSTSLLPEILISAPSAERGLDEDGIPYRYYSNDTLDRYSSLILFPQQQATKKSYKCANVCTHYDTASNKICLYFSLHRIFTHTQSTIIHNLLFPFYTQFSQCSPKNQFDARMHLVCPCGILCAIYSLSV